MLDSRHRKVQEKFSENQNRLALYLIEENEVFREALEEIITGYYEVDEEDSSTAYEHSRESFEWASRAIQFSEGIDK